MKFIKMIRQKKHKLSNIWKLTDNVIKIVDIVPNQKPEFSSRFNINDTYCCMRDMNLVNTNVYVKEEDLEKFKDMKLVYDKERDLINISILKRYVIKKDAYSIVANRTVPAAVNIKYVWYVNIMDLNLFIETVYRLQPDAQLFKELLNFQNLIDKHHLKQRRNNDESNKH